ncbi:MAG: glycosyltransferase [Chthonomonadaceae bacterium]|nr:glycosyltransferase [Chthonomonadaceae bacterium]
MRPLKIAIFSDSALPVLNGVSVSVDALIKALRANGHSVFLYTTSYPGHRDSDPNVTRFPAIHTPWTKDYPLSVPPFYFWFHEFKRRNFDIVHTHSPFTVGFVGLRWAQSCEIPVVSTYHTLYDKYVHYVPFFPKFYLRYKIAKHTNFYYNCVDHVVTPSAAAKRWLNKHSVTKPVTVVPTGVPEPEQADGDALRRELGVSPLRKVMLYTGRLAVEKNMKTLLDASKIVFNSTPNSELWVVGDGPARDALSREARGMGIGDQARFFGFVPRAGLGRFYAAANVFTFCSITETQGLVVNEAMSYGLPAVVIRGGGASASVENGVNGFVVGNDPDAFACQVLSLFQDPLLYEAMAERALAMSKRLTVRAMADSIIDVYHQALMCSGDRPPPHGTHKDYARIRV